MIQDNANLYGEMSRFFRALPPYMLAADEQIELVYTPRGENRPTRRECFPDLEQASQRAISLGPAHNVFLQVVVEPGTTPWNTDSTQLLASWCARDRRPDDHFVGDDGNAILTELLPLPHDEPSLVAQQYYPEGSYTCVAAWYYYRSRCPERARRREAREAPPERGER
jgi:hypothetical protein